MKALRLKPAAFERLGEAVEHVRPDHVATDAGVAPARQVEVGRHLVGGAARGEVVAEARAVGDGAAIARDQVEPLRRPAREVARRQIVDRELARERRHQEADQAHVVIERQPARGAVAYNHVEAGRPGHAGKIGHQGALRDLHAVRMARAARGELDVAEVGRPERAEIDRFLRQRVDRRQAAMQADGREIRRRHRPGSRQGRRYPPPPRRPTRRAGGAAGRDRRPCRRSRGESRRAPAAGRHTGRRRRARRSPARCRP